MLIVDDEPDILLLLQMGVSAAGHETTLAADGDVALQRIREGTFDVVLLDLFMPVLDGWQVLEQLQGQSRAPAVIVLSALPDASRSLKLGAADCMSKPFDMDNVVSAIARYTDHPAGNGSAPGEHP